LHNPANGSRLCNNITGVPILNGSLREGMPLTYKMCSPLLCPLQNPHWGSCPTCLEGSLKPSHLLAKLPYCEEPKSHAHANTHLWHGPRVVKGRWPQPWLVCP
jgi:hypothetical protein